MIQNQCEVLIILLQAQRNKLQKEKKTVLYHILPHFFFNVFSA